VKIENIQKWIALKHLELFNKMRKSVDNDERWGRLRGAYDVLEQLHNYILLNTNPHNREDIAKALAKSLAYEDCRHYGEMAPDENK